MSHAEAYSRPILATEADHRRRDRDDGGDGWDMAFQRFCEDRASRLGSRVHPVVGFSSDASRAERGDGDDRRGFEGGRRDASDEKPTTG
jgi:hypothetical protein